MCYVSYNETVLSLKNEVSIVEGTEIDKQRLYFKDEELRDDKLLSSYRIMYNSTVYLEQEVPITLSTPVVKTVMLTLRGSDTAKYNIHQIFTKEGIEPERQLIMFNDLKLNGHSVLRIYMQARLPNKLKYRLLCGKDTAVAVAMPLSGGRENIHSYILWQYCCT